MVADPAETPVTLPEPFTVITEVLLLLQENGSTGVPWQSTPVDVHCTDWPMGTLIGFGLEVAVAATLDAAAAAGSSRNIVDARGDDEGDFFIPAFGAGEF